MTSLKRVVLNAEHQTLIKQHGLDGWVGKKRNSVWPASEWNVVVDRVRDLFVVADLEPCADDVDAIVKAVANLVVQRQTFIRYFLDKNQRNYKPSDIDEWGKIAEVVARILVQRYYREMK